MVCSRDVALWLGRGENDDGGIGFGDGGVGGDCVAENCAVVVGAGAK